MILELRQLLRQAVANVRPPHRRIREVDLFKSAIARLFGCKDRIARGADDENVVASSNDYWLGDNLPAIFAGGMAHHALAEVDVALELGALKPIDWDAHDLLLSKVRIRVVGNRENNTDRYFISDRTGVLPRYKFR